MAGGSLDARLARLEKRHATSGRAVLRAQLERWFAGEFYDAVRPQLIAALLTGSAATFGFVADGSYFLVVWPDRSAAPLVRQYPDAWAPRVFAVPADAGDTL